jgi:hypothetical protein
MPRRPLVACTLVAALIAGLAPAEDKPSATAKAPARGKAKADPVPGYELRTIEGFQVLINRKALAEIEKTKGEYEVEPLEVLEHEFRALGHILMPKLLKVLQGVRVWVEWDELPRGVEMTEEQRERGPRVVALYRSGSPLRAAQEGKIHPLKMNAVEVMTLKRLTDMHQPGQAKEQIILLHELCHVVHHVFLNYDNVEVKRAYQQAIDRGLYGTVYARTSEAEYFAEVSCAYLDRCNRAPHTAEELKDYDPVGYQLMEKVWGKQDVIAKAREKVAKEREARAKRNRPPLAVGPKPAASAPAPEPKAVDAEKAAAQKLEFARSLLRDGKAEKAKERLRELVQAYPDTKAAEEAAKVLEGLK